MACKIFMAAMLVAASLASFARADIDPTRVHVVDYFPTTTAGPPSFYIRGNSPMTKDSSGQYVVDFTNWFSAMQSAANSGTNNTTPGFPPTADKLYIIDISLENFIDHGFFNEEAYFKANPTQGKYINWELLGAVVWPTAYSAAEQQHKIEDGSIWKQDQLPTRLPLLRAMLEQGPPPGYDALAVYTHCAAGCDRTGEIVGSYRMLYQLSPTATVFSPIYERNCVECGRCPNYFSSGMQGWFCITANLYNRTAAGQITDCVKAYHCELFKKCNATGI